MSEKKPEAEYETLKLGKQAKKKAKGHAQGFSDFVRTHGVVGLAIGFVIGTQARVLVDQLSNSFINPLLGLIIGSGEGLTVKKFAITLGNTTAVFKWGAFVYALINFLLIAVLIYLVYRWLHLDKLDKK